MSVQQVCAYVLAALIIVSVLLYARIYREVRLAYSQLLQIKLFLLKASH